MLLLSQSFHISRKASHINSSILINKTVNRYASARPSLDDVERISKGQAAKKRGVGSRQVPHRLNNEERIEWENAKNRNFLTLRGSGWRRQRGDSPLANIYRQICDAKNIPAISIERGLGISGNQATTNPVIINPDLDTPKNSDYTPSTAAPTTDNDNSDSNNNIEDIVTIDFSPLRTGPTDKVAQMAAICIEKARLFSSLVEIDDKSDTKMLG